MGQCPNGWIAFGVDLGFENNPFYEEPETEEKDNEEGFYMEDIDDYLNYRFGGAKLDPKKIPIEILTYGYHFEETCGYFIALKGTYQRGPEWGCEPISSNNMRIMHDLDKTPAVAKAREFCTKYDLSKFEKPSWYVGCTYG